MWSKPRARQRYVPHLEVLEDRRLLAVKCKLIGSTLQIIGDGNPNAVMIADNGTGNTGNFAGTSIDGFDCSSFSGVNLNNTIVNNVVVTTNKASDSVTYNLTGTVSTPRNITVELGDGGDTFMFNASQNINATTGVLALLVCGGDGNDTINTTYSGELNGTFEYTVEGGKGNDPINTNISLSNSGGVFIGRVQAQNGNDKSLVYNLSISGSPTPAVLALLDGGPGNNFCVVSGGVAVINCKQ
jgi:hypothetical protein